MGRLGAIISGLFWLFLSSVNAGCQDCRVAQNEKRGGMTDLNLPYRPIVKVGVSEGMTGQRVRDLLGDPILISDIQGTNIKSARAPSVGSRYWYGECIKDRQVRVLAINVGVDGVVYDIGDWAEPIEVFEERITRLRVAPSPPCGPNIP